MDDQQTTGRVVITDPIIALTTPPGRGAVGVIRISGQALANWFESLCGQKLVPRHAHYLALKDPKGDVLDHVLALYFEGPYSFTGEDILELHAHGGPVVLRLLIAHCLDHAVSWQCATPTQCPNSRLESMRLAQPGEFSYRAFMNGKIDLAQAEALADLIDATTEAAALSASRSLSGEFSRRILRLSERMTQLRTLVEATLDFPEEDVTFLEHADALGQICALELQIQSAIQGATQGAMLRDGLQVVIAGQPNVGKSSLINALAGQDVAIVNPQAGTTRDKLQQVIALEGVPVHVIDTAGLRESHDIVEKEGIRRAWDAVQKADVVIWLRDLSQTNNLAYCMDDDKLGEALRKQIATGAHVLQAWNKRDTLSMCNAALQDAEKDLWISTVTGEGLTALKTKILEIAGWYGAEEGLCLTRERHLRALREAQLHLHVAAEMLRQPQETLLEQLAEELRLGQQALGKITGQVSTEELLGHIFSNFCIGK
jgi:tRNA modification GTPase